MRRAVEASLSPGYFNPAASRPYESFVIEKVEAGPSERYIARPHDPSSPYLPEGATVRFVRAQVRISYRTAKPARRAIDLHCYENTGKADFCVIFDRRAPQ